MSEQMDRLEQEVNETASSVAALRDSVTSFTTRALEIIEELRAIAQQNNDAKLGEFADKLDTLQADMSAAAAALPSLDVAPAAPAVVEDITAVEDGAQNP